jgi:hypothetical protein
MSAPSGKRSVQVENAIAFGLLTAIGGYAFVTALGYGLFKENSQVGPGLVPAVVGAGVVLLGGWELVGALRGRREDHSHGLAEVAASAISGSSTASSSGEAVEGAAGSGGSTSPGTAPDDDVDIFGRTAATRGRQLVTVFLALLAAVLLVPLLGFLGAFFLMSVFI